MKEYLGIVVEQCFRNDSLMEQFSVIATRRGSWNLHLVSVPEQQISSQISLLQENMVSGDAWYAHFFRGEELVVVYRDAVFRTTINPADWGPAVEHGLLRGVPREQLDFAPRTKEEAHSFFRVAPPESA